MEANEKFTEKTEFFLVFSIDSSILFLYLNVKNTDIVSTFIFVLARN